MKTVSRKLKERNRKIFYYSMVALPLLHFFIFYICVNANSFVLAFTDYSVESGSRFVWFQNFSDVLKNIFTEPTMKLAFGNSFKSWLSGLLISTTLSLIFSYYIYKKYVASGFFRIILFIPQIVSSIVFVIMYRYFLVYALPRIMEPFGVEVPDLLDDVNKSWYVVWFYGLWTGFATSTMMYVGAMNNISDSIVEYAKIDGFSPMQEFIYITVPMIFPTITTFLTVSLAGIFTNQMALYQFFGKDAEPQTWTVGYYMYATIMKSGASEYPYLSAFGLVMTLITAPITLIVKRLLEKYGPGVH